MEMHQVRYFLAVARELNFTRAAESCNVAQPSLTRAIKQLEDELGGELFRRERNLSHLTELGQRMLPMLQQCYDSALTAKSLAHSMKSGAVAPLSIALSVTVNIMLLISFLSELVRVFPGLELRFIRGTNEQIAELLKKGEAEVAVAGPMDGAWERLDFVAAVQRTLSSHRRRGTSPRLEPELGVAIGAFEGTPSLPKQLRTRQGDWRFSRSARRQAQHEAQRLDGTGSHGATRMQFRRRHCSEKLRAQFALEAVARGWTDDRAYRLCLWGCRTPAIDGCKHSDKNATGGRLASARKPVAQRQRTYRKGGY